MAREQTPARIDLRKTLHFVTRVGDVNLHDNGINYAPDFKGMVRGDVILRHPDKFKFKHAWIEKQWTDFLKTLSSDLEALTVAELRDLADERGVDVPKDARKADLVSALSE